MLRSLFGKDKGKNRKQLADICRELITTYEKNSNETIISCKDDLMKSLNSTIERASEEIEKWNHHDNDFTKNAHKLIIHACFDMLASGQYHLHRGILDPMICSASLMRVHDKAVKWSLDKGFISQEGIDVHYEMLNEAIRDMG